MNFQDQIEVSFTENDLLGQGQFGKVYKATGVDGTRYAAKVFPPNCQWNMAVEVMYLTGLASHPHPRILRFYGTGRRQNPPVLGEAVLVMELLPSSLQQELQKTQKPFEEDRALEIVRQVLEGLAHLHKLKMLHRDIKPDNILLTEEGDVKLADFGTSTVRPRPRSIRGTLAYMAPEVVKPEDYTSKVDIYSVGIVLVHLLHGSVVHVGEGGYELKGEQLQFGKKRGTLSLRLPDQNALRKTTQDLMSSMIRLDPAERPDAETLLRHEAFAHGGGGGGAQSMQTACAASLQSPVTPHSLADTVAASPPPDDTHPGDHHSAVASVWPAAGGRREIGGGGVELVVQASGAAGGASCSGAAGACGAAHGAEEEGAMDFVGLQVEKPECAPDAQVLRSRVPWTVLAIGGALVVVLCLAAGVLRLDRLWPAAEQPSELDQKPSTLGVLRAAKWEEVERQLSSRDGADADVKAADHYHHHDHDHDQPERGDGHEADSSLDRVAAMADANF